MTKAMDSFGQPKLDPCTDVYESLSYGTFFFKNPVLVFKVLRLSLKPG